MNNKTKELGLVLTGVDEAEKTFQQFRLELSGNTGNSNMEIIDNAFGELVTLIGNKKVYIRAVDGYIQYSEDDQTWHNVIALSELKGAKGDTGDPGNDYVLTSADKTAIATEAAGLVDISGKLDKSGGTMSGKIVLPYGDLNAGISNTVNTKLLGYSKDADGNLIFVAGEPNMPLVLRGSDVAPIYNGKKLMLEGEGSQISGLTAEQISALDGMFKVAAYTKDVAVEYAAFKTAFGIEGGGTEPDEPENPEITLTSISVTYSGGSVPAGTAVSELTGIVVTARYSDGTSEPVTAYTLSGTIAEGNNTITVNYGGKTTTFTVVGVYEVIDTSPVIAQYDVGYGTYAENKTKEELTYSFPGMCITKVYPYTPDIEKIKASDKYDAENDYLTTTGVSAMITCYTPSLKMREAGYSIVNMTTKASKIMRLRDTTVAECHSNTSLTAAENPAVLNAGALRYRTSTMYANGLSFTLSTLDIDDSYAYWTSKDGFAKFLPVGVRDGDIIFAGKNTKYYGMRNISQYTGE